MILIQLTVLLACIFIGARMSGIGLGFKSSRIPNNEISLVHEIMLDNRNDFETDLYKLKF